jgi:hypothetical protein
MKGKKRKILRLMRTKGLWLREAAKAVGITVGQVFIWATRDKEFDQAVKAILLVRQIDFILKWDAVVRSGRPLNLAEQNCVYVAKRLAASIETAMKKFDALRRAKVLTKRQLDRLVEKRKEQ